MQAESWRRSRFVFFGIGGPQFVWMIIFFIIPLISIFLLSFSEKEGIIDHKLVWTFENYFRAFEPLYLEILGKSILIAFLATMICLLLGYPVALAIAFSPEKVKLPLLFAVTLPFWINILIRTYALIAVFRTNGFLNFSLEWFWNIGVELFSWIGFSLGPYQPLELLYTNTTVVLGIVYVFIPFMILPIYAVMERFPKSYLEASMDLGAGYWQSFWKILLPLTLPGILSGVMIVFVPALGAFFIPDILGGTDSLLIGNIIERQFLGANNWPFGAALSFLLMYITLFAIILRGVLSARAVRLKGENV